MKYYECKHVVLTTSLGNFNRPIKERLAVVAAALARPAMQLYNSLTPEERETILCIDLEPTLADEDVMRTVFYADPTLKPGHPDYGIWKSELDKVAAGDHPKFEPDGSMRTTLATPHQ
jgi:hypothetical protein